MEKEIKEIQETIKSCNDKLEALLSKAKDVPTPTKFEVGKWYKNIFGDIVNFQGGNSGFGANSIGEWFDNDRWEFDIIKHNYIPATKEEIESALIAEAKRRGFKQGVRFVGLNQKMVMPERDDCVVDTKSRFMLASFKNRANDDKHALWVSCNDGKNNGVVFANGKWSEIIKEDKIEIGGYEVKFCNDILCKSNTVTIKGHDYTTIDGHKFTKEFWQAAKLISEHSKAKIMVGCSKQFDVSLETINKILSKP